MSKLNKSIVLLFIMFLVSQTTFSQKKEKIYYDKDWKLTNFENGKYYRIYNGLDTTTSLCELKSYYKSGAIQWEGNVKNSDVNATNCLTAKCEGKAIWYHENGKIKTISNYTNGRPNSWSTDCDEFGKCQKVFFDDFALKEDDNGWEPSDRDEFKSEIIAGEGFLMKTKSEGGYLSLINLPIDISNNFSIETIINFKSGEKNNGQGLIWGFKDWENYYYFYISANGYFKIGAKTEGLSLEFAKWTQSPYINQNNQRNLIKVNKIKDKVYFSINSQIVASEDFYTFRGNNIGFSIQSGKKEVLFERLLVRQDIGENEVQSKFSSSSKWKGNGTGFFIDPRGYITTNYHVVEEASEIEIDLVQNGQKKSYKTKIISTDKQHDLAIIKIDDPTFKTYLKLPYNFKIPISDVGSNVFVLGYPLALSVMGDEVKFTDGKISSKTGFQGNITTYQISVPVQPGNSGGPVFDFDGNIIGVVNSKIMAAENVSYAIKSSYLKNLLDVLPEDINVPNDQSLSSLTLTEKIKLLSDYVVLVKIK